MTAALQRPQHLAAIDKAQRHRREQFQTRSWIREPAETWASRERLAEVLIGDPLPHLAGVLVVDALCWCRGVKHGKALRILRTAELGGLKTIGKLTDRQRLHLAGLLRHGYHDRPEL